MERCNVEKFVTCWCVRWWINSLFKVINVARYNLIKKKKKFVARYNESVGKKY